VSAEHTRFLCVPAAVEAYSPAAWSSAGVVQSVWSLVERSASSVFSIDSYCVVVHVVSLTHVRSACEPGAALMYSVA
jgi:hypothetical protein